jgi:hypothetical protein
VPPSSNPATNLIFKTKKVQQEMRSWAAKHFKGYNKAIQRAKYVIQILDRVEEVRMLSAPELNLRIKLKEHTYHLAHIQEMKWRQRSTTLWLKQEDANSKYYHTLASARRAHNHIPQVTIQPTNPTDPPTTMTHTPQIISEFTAFYKTILGTPSPDLLNPCLEALYPQPNPHFLRPLVDPISIQEIKNVVFSLPKDKANGPNGFPIEFFQEYWEFISDDLHSMVTAFYHNRLDLWRINQAYITLIPKSTTPENIGLQTNQCPLSCSQDSHKNSSHKTSTIPPRVD